jgi:hypothetical protein
LPQALSSLWPARFSAGGILRLAVLLVSAALLQPVALPAAPVIVRHLEGLVHGFLVLRTLVGNTLADGDLIQVAHGDRVTSRLVFRFKDGSLHDETAVFSQHRNFQLLSDHLVQKGPAFEHPLEASVNRSTGQVTVRNTDGNGKEKVVTDRLDLPLDLANGLVLTLLKNIRSDAPQTEVSMVVFTPKPRLVRLAITSQGEDPFSIGGSTRKATHYVVKVEIGGAAGLVTTLLGSNPQTLTFGFSVGRLQPSSNPRVHSTWAALFGALNWPARCGQQCSPRTQRTKTTLKSFRRALLTGTTADRQRFLVPSEPNRRHERISGSTPAIDRHACSKQCLYVFSQSQFNIVLGGLKTGRILNGQA